MSEQLENFWWTFVQSAACPPGVDAGKTPPAFAFGDNPTLADELGQLVYAGIKTATCGTLWEWEHDRDPLPQTGQLEIVLDGHGKPLCVIEMVEVTIKPYNEVDASFAYAEGEDDRTLESWRREHWKYFSRVLPQIGRAPDEAMPLVCRRFRVVFKRQQRIETRTDLFHR
ncbi:MAG: ASCH domain-containing protein [Caldilineaceae bacterium]